MLQSYHQEICQRTLANHFSPRALAEIIASNLAQDNLRGQIGHPEFHYDDNAFAAGDAYIEAQRQIIWEALGSAPNTAWEAFGRLTHAAQDFYAHSNYVRLWLAAQPEGEWPASSEVEALASGIIHHPELRSGKVYLWDWLAFIPGLHSLAYRLLPEDSHTHMNLDAPKQGPLFPYALEAAIHRTIHEYQIVTERMNSPQFASFTDRQ